MKNKISLDLGELLVVAFYSFIAAGAFGTLLSATWYYFAGQFFPRESLESLTQTIQIGAVLLFLAGIFVYYRKIKALVRGQQES